MSNITDIYNACLAQLATDFPSKVRIPDPYSLDRNPNILMKDAYGLRYTGSTREELTFCDIQFSHGFTIVLTRESMCIDTKSDFFDDPTLALLEDANTVAVNFYGQNELGEELKIDSINVISTSAIQNFFSDKNSYLSIEINIAIFTHERIQP